MFISFENPYYLLLLFVIPVFILVHFISLDIRSKKALKFANFEAIAKVKGIEIYSKNIVPLVVNSIIILLMVFCISGTSLNIKKSGTESAFIIALDTSQSMSANDIKPNRITFAKEIAKQIIKQLPDDTEIGIVSLGSYTLIEKELSKNKGETIKTIESLEIRGVGGTGYYETAVTTSNLLVNNPSKVLILLSDGQDNIEDTTLAAKYAKEKNIMIHTVPIGTLGGGDVFYGTSKLDLESLEILSKESEGILIYSESEEEIISKIKETLELKEGVVKKNLTDYLAIAAIILFIAEYILTNIKYGELN